MLMMKVAIFLASIFLLIEMIVRIRLLWYSPFHIKLAYALFFLSPKSALENILINQRIMRGGFKSETELFKHYEIISGKPFEEIKIKFGREGSWLSILNRKYYSGGHGLFEQEQRMHLGLAPKPCQDLQTLNTDERGWRKTGFDFPHLGEHQGEKKICLLLGGSVAFGSGATSDEATIAGRIGYYLNKHFKNSEFIIVNNAMSGYTSHQELLALLQFEGKPDYVISLSGYNELLMIPDPRYKISFLAKQSERPLTTSFGGLFWNAVESILRRFVIFSELIRFIKAFVDYDSFRERETSNDINIYPMQ